MLTDLAQEVGLSNALKAIDPEIHHLIGQEMRRQADGLELICSENYVSEAVMAAMGTILNNKYSEGYPGRKYYGGAEFVEEMERLAIDRVCGLFDGAHANVQPHAGAPANMAAYFALAEIGDTILGMDLSHGGHLTHGHPVTHVAKIFRFVRYKMSDVETGAIDYDAMRDTARREKPRIILAGYSSYPRTLNYEIISSIAKEVGAYAVADVAHFAGLIAGKAMENPLHHGFDLLISTTHKTLRGPRGGVIISKDPSLGARVDKSVFPGLQGGPIVQMIAAKAVAFKEAGAPSFVAYANQVLRNATVLADGLMSRGVKLITNGTDNHLVLVDAVRSWGVSGKIAESRLDAAGITVNKNVIPDDARPATDPSGVRIGTPALTTRGMREREMDMVASWIVQAASASDAKSHADIRDEVRCLARAFRVPGVLIS